jgi:Rho-binding antiterminator
VARHAALLLEDASMTSTYVPINCEFHDVLEATATTRRRVAVLYIADDGQQQTVRARITDLQASNGVEHMVLDDEKRIRLDAILSVDGMGLDSVTR